MLNSITVLIVQNIRGNFLISYNEKYVIDPNYSLTCKFKSVILVHNKLFTITF